LEEAIFNGLRKKCSIKNKGCLIAVF